MLLETDPSTNILVSLRAIAVAPDWLVFEISRMLRSGFAIEFQFLASEIEWSIASNLPLLISPGELPLLKKKNPTSGILTLSDLFE